MKHLILFFLLSTSAFSQDYWNTPFDAASMNIDFMDQSTAVIDTSGIDIVSLWWSVSWRYEVAGYYLEACVPIKDQIKWSGYRHDIGFVGRVSFSTKGFPYAFRVTAYDRDGIPIRTSQTRYIKQ
jgi:hypothetical protein